MSERSLLFTYTHIHTHTYTYIHIHTYIHTCMECKSGAVSEYTRQYTSEGACYCNKVLTRIAMSGNDSGSVSVSGVHHLVYRRSMGLVQHRSLTHSLTCLATLCTQSNRVLTLLHSLLYTSAPEK